jgi:hypothetical protein
VKLTKPLWSWQPGRRRLLTAAAALSRGVDGPAVRFTVIIFSVRVSGGARVPLTRGLGQVPSLPCSGPRAVTVSHGPRLHSPINSYRLGRTGRG